MGVVYVPRGIVALYEAGFPATVFRAVVGIAVFSFQGESRVRSGSHIIVEVLKRGLPTWTDPDTSATVVLVVVAGLTVASGLHPYPDDVLWGEAFTVGTYWHGTSPLKWVRRDDVESSTETAFRVATLSTTLIL